MLVKTQNLEAEHEKRQIEEDKYLIDLILGTPNQELCSNQWYKQYLRTEIDFLLGFFFLSMGNLITVKFSEITSVAHTYM